MSFDEPQKIKLLYTPETRRAIIRFILPGFIERDYNKTKSFNLFRERGLGINYRDYSNIWDRTLGIETQAGLVKFVNKDAIPNPDNFAVADWDVQTKYMFTGSYTIYDTETGESINKTWSWKTDSFGDRESIEYEMLRQVSEQYHVSGIYFSEVSLRKAFRNG